MMDAPSTAKAEAVARPIPVSAPVINTTGAGIAVSITNLDQGSRESGRGANLHARRGSVGAVTAVDSEDMTGDEPCFVRTDEHDAVGDFLGEAEPTERN